MADKYIKEYTEATTPNSTDGVLIDEGLGSYKYCQIANLLKGINLSGVGTIGCGAITSSGRIVSDDTTDATTTTDGSLQTDGGLSVAKKAVFGDTVTVGAYKLPATDGTASQVLKTNGSGVVTWQAESGGSGGSPISIVEKIDNHTLALADLDKLIEMNKGTAVTLTIPKNSVVEFAIGDQVKGYQKGAGKVTIAPVDGDVTIRSAGSADETFEQYSTFMLTKIAINTWLLEGDIA